MTAAMPKASRKAVDVEQLLQWCYREELPKKQISSAEGIWDRIHDIGTRGGVDVGDSAAQRYPHFGLPHPDAERIEKAVAKLPDHVIDWEAQGEAILGPLASALNFSGRSPAAPARKPRAGWFAAPGKWKSVELDRPRDVIMVRSIRTAALVTMHAAMGTRPDWCDETPQCYPVPARCGPGNQLIGERTGANYYTEGSCCPLRWEPSALEIAAARADYVAWHHGLVTLAEMLDLSDHIAQPPAAHACPWSGPTVAKTSIFRMPGNLKTRVLPLKPTRPTAGPPASQWKRREATG